MIKITNLCLFMTVYTLNMSISLPFFYSQVSYTPWGLASKVGATSGWK